MDPLEADLLRLSGYIPDNVQACRDMQAGRITMSRMWQIINRNIDLSEFLDIVNESNTRPAKRDRVKCGDEWGHISYINYEEQEVGVFFYTTKSLENIPLDNFTNYDSKGGRTTWLLETWL